MGRAMPVIGGGKRGFYSAVEPSFPLFYLIAGGRMKAEERSRSSHGLPGAKILYKKATMELLFKLC